MKTVVFMLILFCVALTALPLQISAWQCADKPEPAEALKQFDVVFTGIVTGI